ncbi:hypothetical protein GSI_13373 [Ganoderma sinense ZZ0214-1]|uniref:Carboxylic ester hydrolase n=1 Tax=Ganoderma sinense ZZ0214-1 TaxID=1077348 RepID=A0A2G8RVE9_9APHY|nr:hypothetical protein GSI_13373 [Ganoderma sinense ZZ0214-1]
MVFPSGFASFLPFFLSLAPFSTLDGDVPPTVRLDQATVYGTTNGSVTSYFNIPFAEPPIGDLRLRLPKPIDNYNGTINATQVGPQCIQQPSLALRQDMPAEMLRDIIAALNAGSVKPVPGSEDCLNLNVLVPTGTTEGAKLPVVAFIYGGAFSTGSNTQYNGAVMVQRSIEMGQPIIFAAMNYRLHTYGFLGGQEVKDAGVGNIGLQDQREALRWVKKRIAAFGGDPDKVTIWGPSAGGSSVGSQLVANGGDDEGLFRAAVLSCGSLVPTGDLSEQQRSFDIVVEGTGCSGAADKLECLRGVPAENLTTAAAAIPNVFDYPGLSAAEWFPHADGVFIKEPVHEAVLAGRIANVPFIAGDSLDEGTAFATGAWNITTDDEFLDYLRDLYFPGASSEEVAPLLALYPSDPAQGSPFGTGNANQLAPMYKRVSAFQGDFGFQAQRRTLLTLRSGKQPAWAYMVERRRAEGLGYPHGRDLVSMSNGEELTDYVIQFATTLDPNGGSGSNRTIPWPRYDPAARQMLLVLDGEEPLAIGRDDAREEAMEFIVALSLKYPL